MARPATEPDRRRDRRDHARRNRPLLRALSPLAHSSAAEAQALPVPPFTLEHEQLRAEIRGFVEQRLRPRAEAWEAAEWFPSEAFGWLAEAGYLGLRFPAEYGGREDPVAAAVLCEELARCGSGGVAAGLGAHTSIALPPIWTFGTEEQKQRYLVPGLKGAKIAALAISEPDAGSDVASVRTRARRVDGGYVVDGAKTFITGGVRADVLVTAVRTGETDAPDRHRGISFLIIERGPGVSSSPLRKLGWHASDTAEIAFDDVFVPEENLLGAEHGGFYLIMANFQWERLVMALGAIGGMQACFEMTLEFVRNRDGGCSQSVRHQLAEIAVEIEAGRDMTYAALRRFAAGEEAVREVTIAKLKTQRAAFDVIDVCFQIHGHDVPPELERALRDARLGPIGGGTDEIMKEILGRSLGL
ncbi:MAG TPA: acyl-CoA dehydrogenase family protein [Solirubrobacteraceae bacterium]